MTPDVFFDSEDQEGRAFVPTRSATSEAEAREHLLFEIVDEIDHDAFGADILAAWTYLGIESTGVCECDTIWGDFHTDHCPHTVDAHVFEFNLSPEEEEG